MQVERRWRAMGSDCHVVVVGQAGDALVERAIARIEELESRWSRFRPTSEVSALNGAAGAPVTVSDDTWWLVSHAIEGWKVSGGAFDPTVAGAVAAAGYDRSFERLAGGSPLLRLGPLGVGCSHIELGDDTVRLPAGVGFDPGGIGKGLAADMVAKELREAGADGVLVNLGGDVRVSGTGPQEDEGWTLGIVHPWHDEPFVLLGVAEGAIATSTTLRRRWTATAEDGSAVERHHLIDPLTGLPSDTDVTLASIVDGQAWRAEVLAKAVLLSGSEHPFDLLDGTGVNGLVVLDDGTIRATDGLVDHLDGAALPANVEVPER